MQMVKDYELEQKVLIFLIGISAGAGRFIPRSVEIPISWSEWVDLPVAEFWGEPLVLVVLLFLYIMAEAVEPSWIAEFRGQESEETNKEE